MRRVVQFFRNREWVAATSAIGAGLAIATTELDTLSDAIDEVGVPDGTLGGLGWLQWGIGLVTIWGARRGVNSNDTLADRDATISELKARIDH